ncbi:c-type cytochrome [Cohnella luojiensis]|uniref:Cytochrome c n=1 Tax=Cohnella luojiensis TaxID=652876 RepID=A0A4Y8LYP3_9BACL|nr:cytochrome c [Cohnella luojiensis]TFE27462.1 cytochrome c [Cohnella luojiensis]
MYKWLLSGLIVLTCVFGVYLLVSSLPPKAETRPELPEVTVPDKPVNVNAADQIYKQNCLSCHGDQLQGSIGPQLSNVGGKLSKEEIYKRIQKGGGGMPPFDGRLTEDEIINITNWLADKK